MNNLDLVFSLFNINVFQQAKNNITDIQYYFDTNASTSGNKLIGELINAIKTYNFDQIDLPLFNSILTRCGKTPAESSKIVGELIKWKSYNKKQMEPAKRFLDDIVANSIIQRANRLYDEHPADFLKYLKNAEFKTSTLDTLSSTAFGQIDINSVMENEMSDGVTSCFDFINQSFKPDCKYPMGQMGIICMPPGCFVGDTEIYTSNGIETLKELCGRTNIEVYSFNGKEKIKSIAEKCIKTKEVSKLIKILTSDGGIIKSTEDHKFLLSNNFYIEAKDLKIGDELMSFSDNYDNILVISKEIIELDKPEPVYDIINVDLYSNFAIKTSENSGIFVHNCGKTLMAFNEALHMASQGRKCHYLAMGDISYRDFIIRMSAIYSGLPFWDAKNNVKTIFNGISQLVGNNLEVTIVPAGTLTVDEYVDYVLSRDFEVLFADYDGNFKVPGLGDNMYLAYGDVYEKLTKLTLAGKLLFVMSQPNKIYWKNEILELSDVGESAKKVQCCDLLITRGRVTDNPNHLGKFKIAKNRRGEEGVEVGSIRLNNGRFMIVSNGVYEMLKQDKTKKNYTESDIRAMEASYAANANQIQQQLNQVANRMNNNGGGQRSNNQYSVSGPTPFSRP